MKPYGMHKGHWHEVDRTDGGIGVWLIQEPSKKTARRESFRVLWDEVLEAERRQDSWVKHLREMEAEEALYYMDD